MVIPSRLDILLVSAIISLKGFTTSEIVQLNKCCGHENDTEGLQPCGISHGEVFNLSSKLFSNSGKNLIIPAKLRESNLSCENRTELTLNLPEIVNSTNKWTPGRHNFTGFSKDGKFIHLKNVYDSDEFCISSISEEELSISFCNQTCSPSRPCITRCCDYGATKEFEAGGTVNCIPSGEKDWTPTYYRSVWDSTRNEKPKDGIRPIFIYNHVRNWCNYTFMLLLSLRKPQGEAEQHIQVPYKILEDGSVWQKLRRREWIPLKEGTYCIDGVVKFPEDNNTGGYSGLEEDSIIFDCDPERQEVKGYSGSSSLLYGIVFLISSIFFLLTAIVFILLRDKQTIHGWTSLGYVVAMMVSFLTLAFNQLSSIYMTREGLSEDDRPYFTFCAFMGMLGHFSFLAAFVWLTMVNFDIWWTFRFLKPGRKSLKRFWIYMSIAFLVPAIIVGTGIILDFIYRKDPFSDVIIPDYGKTRCYMERRLAPLPYLHAPVATMLGTNLLFFISTAISIHKAKKETDFATSSSTKNEKSGQSMKLFLKLLFIMGIPWIYELFSWGFDEDKKDKRWYQVLGDLLTISQSVFVFIIFVCKTETLNSLSAKYPAFKRLVNNLTAYTRRIARRAEVINPCCARLKTCGLKGTDSSEAHTRSTVVTEYNTKMKSEVSNSTKIIDSEIEVSVPKGEVNVNKDKESNGSKTNLNESIEMDMEASIVDSSIGN